MELKTIKYCIVEPKPNCHLLVLYKQINGKNIRIKAIRLDEKSYILLNEK